MLCTNLLTGVSSSFFRRIDEEVFIAYKEAKIDCMEISLPLTDYESLDYEKIYELSKKHSVSLWSLHLPFSYEVNIANPDISLCEKAIAMHSEIIKKAAKIGIKTFVIHPSGEPNAPEARKQLLQRSADGLLRLSELCADLGATLAVEDLPRTCLGNTSDDILFFLSRCPALRVCFDSNHLTAEDNISFIKKCGKYFVTVHISDYDYIDERHVLPGDAKINWCELIDALEEVGYSGAFMYEVARFREGYNNNKEHTLFDVKENHKLLAERKI